MVHEMLLHNIGRSKELQGNDIRLLLLCMGRNVYPKQVVEELGWKKQNVSGIAKKLNRLGYLEVNKYPVFYRTIEKVETNIK